MCILGRETEGREAKGEAREKGWLAMDKINIRFKRVSEKEDMVRGIDPQFECTGCRRAIGRGEWFLYFKYVYFTNLCFDCWPHTKPHLEQIRTENPIDLSAEGVRREMEKVKTRYEEIKGFRTWPRTVEV